MSLPRFRPNCLPDLFTPRRGTGGGRVCAGNLSAGLGGLMEGTAKDVLARWIVRLLLVPWERLREPKVMHALISTAYLSAAVAGTAVICDGEWWTGGLLLFGGLLPLGSMHGGHWGLERAGLILLMGGFVGWLAGLPEQSATVGELAARAALTFGVVALMAARWYRIRGLDMDPDR